MIELAEDARLLLEQRVGTGAGDHGPEDPLDRDETVERDVPREHDDADPAAPKLAQNLVTPARGIGITRHRRDTPTRWLR